MITRHVWTANFGQTQIYTEDSSGTPSAEPVIEHCYIEDVSITAETILKRKAVTGRTAKKIVPVLTVYDNVSIEIGHMAFNKSDEFDVTNIFNPMQQLRFILRLVDPHYDGVTIENDIYTASFARAESFSISYSDNEIVQCQASIIAESLS